ncbi:Uncharacterised protein [Actinobacillus equuli]|nr:Uncharacterised protein [Actinobacillus equuli]
MGFSVIVELLNIKMRKIKKNTLKHNKSALDEIRGFLM